MCVSFNSSLQYNLKETMLLIHILLWKWWMTFSYLHWNKIALHKTVITDKSRVWSLKCPDGSEPVTAQCSSWGMCLWSSFFSRLKCFNLWVSVSIGPARVHAVKSKFSLLAFHNGLIMTLYANLPIFTYKGLFIIRSTLCWPLPAHFLYDNQPYGWNASLNAWFSLVPLLLKIFRH